MKPKNKTSNPKRSLHHKKITISLLVAAALLILTQAVADGYLLHKQKQQRNDAGLTNLVINAVKGLQQPAAVDAKTGEVYLREAGLVLPPPDANIRGLRYSFSKYKNHGELRVTSEVVMNKAIAKIWVAQSDRDDSRAVFRELPNLQACARGVLVDIDHTYKGTGHLSPAGKVRLADGRKLYLYTENNCNDDLGTIAKYLKTAKSY